MRDQGVLELEHGVGGCKGVIILEKIGQIVPVCLCLIGGFVIIATVCVVVSIDTIVVVVNNPTEAKVSDYNSASIVFNQAVVGLEVTMNNVQAMKILHGSGDVFGIANAQFPWQRVGYIVDDVFESAAADVLEYEIEMLLFGEHDAHKLDDIRVIEVAENLSLFEETLVACVQFGVVYQKVRLLVEVLG